LHRFAIKYFLGSLAVLRRASISFIMSVCLSNRPSVRPSVRPFLCPHGTRVQNAGFWWNLVFKIFFFWKTFKKIKMSLKSDKNSGYFIWRHFHFYDNISLNSS
jgi:hypothetical protein